MLGISLRSIALNNPPFYYPKVGCKAPHKWIIKVMGSEAEGRGKNANRRFASGEATLFRRRFSKGPWGKILLPPKFKYILI